MTASPKPTQDSRIRQPIEAVGRGVREQTQQLGEGVRYTGGLLRLLGRIGDRFGRWILGRGVRIRFESIAQQAIRVGVKSIPIIILVQTFVGIILALNLAPTLAEYGQLDKTATVVAIAILRELGPLISAIVLSGFAGASIAAELGTMVEGEEIKALKAHALDPIRFLVVPRVLATTVMLLLLTVLADVMGVFGGLLTGVFILDINATAYIDATREAVGMADYFTGLFKGAFFGMTIATLACYEGLGVRGGAEGVGRATTTTVVKSIVALIGADCVFTAVFYVLGW